MTRRRAPLDMIAFHGTDGEEDSMQWFTTDERHASQFGSVQRYRVTSWEAVYIDCATDEDLAGEYGADADAILMRIFRAEGKRPLVLRGWEGGEDVTTIYTGGAADVDEA